MGKPVHSDIGHAEHAVWSTDDTQTRQKWHWVTNRGAGGGLRGQMSLWKHKGPRPELENVMMETERERERGYSWGYGYGNRGIAIRFQADTRFCNFSKASAQVWEPHSLLFCAYLLGTLSSGVNAAWAWSWPFTPSSVEIKNEWSHTSTPTIRLHVMHSDFTFTFTIT